MKGKAIFLLALTFLLLYTALTSSIFGRGDYKNQDKYYHIAKSLNPLGCCGGEYYAPLFHIIVYCIAFFIGNFNALNLFVALLLFYLLPHTFNCAYNSFWGEQKDTTAYYLLVLWFPLLTFLINTWPAALNMMFMLVLLSLIFRRANTLLIIGVSILGFFSHTEGGFWILIVTAFYFFLKDKRLSIIMVLIIALILFVYPAIWQRPFNIIIGCVKNMDLNAERLVEVLILWLNPLNLYLIYCGLKERKYLELDDFILFFAVFVAFSSAILDSQLRPILNGMVLLGLYGFKGFEKHVSVGRFMLIYGLLWWLVLVIGIIIM